MRIAVFHNRYIHRGGEDAAVDLDVELLLKAGHDVRLFAVDSRELGTVTDRMRAGANARWNGAIVARVKRFLADHPAEVGHVHNFFPILTPAVHFTLHRAGIPVVQSLHNYRLFCANGLFLRDGRPCEDCVTRGPWNAVRYGCYRDSRLQTALWADATAHHRRRGTWNDLVDRFITPGDFARRKLAAAGLPEDRIVVRPNPVLDPGEPRFGGRGAVYVGRLSPEKGVWLLLDAWRRLGGAPLCIVGTGPEEEAMRAAATDLPNIRFTGLLSPEAVRKELAQASFAVIPSLSYEIAPLVASEAMAAGRPVVAAHPTALTDIVDDGRTGLHFRVGDAESLAQACRRLLTDSDEAVAMGREARQVYEERFAPDRCLDALLSIYQELIDGRSRRQR